MTDHPNDSQPRSPELLAKLRALGDEKSQGLDPYWKWGFCSGWNAALDTATRTQGANNFDTWVIGEYGTVIQSAETLRLMEAAYLAGITQGADAQPVAIYQSRLHTDDEKTWSDCYEATFYACKAYPDKYGTRIVYATRDATPRDAISDDLIMELAMKHTEVVEDGEGSWPNVDWVGFARDLLAASAPRNK